MALEVEIWTPISVFMDLAPRPSKVDISWLVQKCLSPLIHGWWGRCTPPPPVVVCPLVRKSSGNPNLKILAFFQLFIVDAPMKKNPKV